MFPYMTYIPAENKKNILGGDGTICAGLSHYWCTHVPWCTGAVVTSTPVRTQCVPILRDAGAVSRVGRKGGTKVFITGERAPGYRLSPDHFQKFKRMPAPDWAQKMLCIIVPNRRTHLNEFFSCVRK